MDEPTAFASVLREQRILLLAKKENCHFLTRLFASFSTDHYTCLAMEFVEGGDLVSHLVRDGMSQERTRFYSACIVLGLQFLHDRNITHRDLKLENVLLDRDGYAKITDFGISKEGKISSYNSIALNSRQGGFIQFIQTKWMSEWTQERVMYLPLTHKHNFPISHFISR
ncbi:serine/threonine-protein kinase N1-like [Xenopus laevis]|uniref:non-specific serine/threonine protein kinase n=1 Tax=Xenopus laevis TaxID=8355 RepID=A0A8J1LBC8_XENLA|nr:serine/threonine-protein kinase N1-like [Xenopus laevis]